MTDVEDAAHLRVQLRRIGKVRILPVDDLAGGGVEAAFAGHGTPSRCSRQSMAAQIASRERMKWEMPSTLRASEAEGLLT